jgi:hypothetical protein
MSSSDPASPASPVAPRLITPTLALVYLYSPLLLFLLFWFNFPFNCLFAALMILGIAQILTKDRSKISAPLPLSQKLSKGKNETEKPYHLTTLGFLTVLYVVVMVVSVCGIGGFSAQCMDYEKHYFMFFSLSENPWPPAFQYSDGVVVHPVYYFGYYLLPSLVGAVTNNVLYLDLATFIFSVMGFLLGALLFLRYFKLPPWTILLFFGFGGLSLLGLWLLRGPASGMVLNMWAMPLRCNPVMEVILWSPAYLMPILIAAPLMLEALENKKNDQAFLWLVSTFFWHPFATIGLVPFFLWGVLKDRLRCIFSPGNWALFVGAVFPVLVFYSSKVFPEKLVFLGNRADFWNVYPLFILLEFGVWLLLIRREEWKKSLTIITVVSVFVVPFFALGASFDWCFRIGMVLRVIVAGLVLKSLLASPRWYRALGFSLFYGIAALSFIPIFSIRVGSSTITTINREFPDVNPLACSSIHPELLFTNFTPISRQYLGVYDTSPWSRLILKRQDHPHSLPITYKAAHIHSRILGDLTNLDQGDTQRSFLITSGSRLCIDNDGDPRPLTISLRIYPGLNSAGKLEIGMQKASRLEYARMKTAFELLLDGSLGSLYKYLPPVQKSSDDWREINVPSQGVNLRLSMTLPSGCSVIGFLCPPAVPKKGQSDDVRVFRVEDLTLDPTDPPSASSLALKF